MNYFLGVDGGQSHTTALVADARGRILGRGHAGPANHTREPGGRERLLRAIEESVGEALRGAGLPGAGAVTGVRFAGAHLAMTGEPEEKLGIVRGLLRAKHLRVGHDAPGALAGALAGGEGIIVLAGTGSVAYGEAGAGAKRRAARIGGHGYEFGDEGSAFAMVRASLAAALRREDRGLAADALAAALQAHFRRGSLHLIAVDYYAGEISRDRLASFAARVGRLAERGSEAALEILDDAARELAEMAAAAAARLEVGDAPVMVSYGGGVFRSRRLLRRFTAEVIGRVPRAAIVAPRFGPEVGALLLAYREAGKMITRALLANVEAGAEGPVARRRGPEWR